MSSTEKAMSKQHGVDVGRLVDTVNAVQANPDLARFRFHANTEWLGGARVRTQIQEIHQNGQEASKRSRPHEMEGDEPDVLLGADTAPNAVESVLHALTSCLAVGFSYNAAARGIDVKSLSFRIDGDLDLRNFLGIEDGPRPGFQNIRVSYRVESDAPRDQIEELCEYVQETSPVLDIIQNPVPVEVALEG
ncbi:MAG: OsmC family protein [Chloroflexi bacterium]|nr:OsmC family protein [Chloroflexota bacterium]